MNSISKSSALFIILIMAISSLSMVKPANAQSIPAPSAPEFTLSYIVRPYDIGPSYRINPYTGENETLMPAIHTTQSFVDITVKNQHFSPYFSDANGNTINLFYSVNIKGHFSDTWNHYPDSTYQDLFNASASDNTIIEISLGEWPELGPNSQLDFRLQALLGHYNYGSFNDITGFSTYESSDWSNTQTITIGEPSSSTSPNPAPTSTPNPTPTPTVPEFSSWAIPLLLTITLALAGLLVYHKKQKHKRQE